MFAIRFRVERICMCKHAASAQSWQLAWTLSSERAKSQQLECYQLAFTGNTHQDNYQAITTA